MGMLVGGRRHKVTMTSYFFFARSCPVLALCSALSLVYSPAAGAQTNLETNAGIRFNFSTPGAGNMALGGAFLALADDATAAYTNPAGLTNVLEPEVSVEFRDWTYEHRFTDRGRIEGSVPDPENPLDTTRGLVDGEAQDRVTGLSFLSALQPFKHWSLAIYRHELVNFEANFSTQGAFLAATRGRSPLGIPGELDGRLASLHNRMTLDVRAVGVATAFRLSPRLSLGLGVARFDFAIDSTADRFVPPLKEEPSFRPEDVVNFQTQTGEDHDLGMTAGFLWRSPDLTWSVGGVFRQGPDFTFLASSKKGPGSSLQFAEADQEAQFHVPDVYGVGIAFSPKDSIRMTLDFDRVEYSDLMKGFTDIFDFKTLFPSRDPELDRFKIDDADEVHVGFEYGFIQRPSPIFLRIGAWYDPDHSLRFEGDNEGFRAVFRSHSDETHLSLGVGLSRRKYHVDAAFDFSQRVRTVSLSLVARY
jgi:long-chain fatty acid transport protein